MKEIFGFAKTSEVVTGVKVTKRADVEKRYGRQGIKSIYLALIS